MARTATARPTTRIEPVTVTPPGQGTGQVVAVCRDLLLASRIEEAARSAARPFRRVDEPAALPPAATAGVDLLLVAWDERRPGWAEAIRAWRDAAPPTTRLILFGPHTDLPAHADARAAGLGPMTARSRLVATLPELLATDAGQP
jgi:hypothetical protein